MTDHARKLELESDALRVEYESRAAWISDMNQILGYDNSDGFHSEPDPKTIARNLVIDNQRLLEALKDIATNYDHDGDAHKYHTGCRVCIAQSALNKLKME